MKTQTKNRQSFIMQLLSDNIKIIVYMIVFCTISSCSITGDFAITKRKYNSGYSIEFPSVIKEYSFKTKQLRKGEKISDTLKRTNTENMDNAVASVGEEYFIKETNILETAPINKPEKFHQKKYKFSETDTTKKVNVSNKKEENKINDRVKKKIDGMSVASFIMALLAVPCFLLFFIASFMGVVGSLLLSMLAIIMGAQGLKRIKKNQEKHSGKAFATLGIVLASIWLLLMVLIIIALASIDWSVGVPLGC